MDELGMGKDLGPFRIMLTTFLWVWNYSKATISCPENMDTWGQIQPQQDSADTEDPWSGHNPDE